MFIKPGTHATEVVSHTMSQVCGRLFRQPWFRHMRKWAADTSAGKMSQVFVADVPANWVGSSSTSQMCKRFFRHTDDKKVYENLFGKTAVMGKSIPKWLNSKMTDSMEHSYEGVKQSSGVWRRYNCIIEASLGMNKWKWMLLAIISHVPHQHMKTELSSEP